MNVLFSDFINLFSQVWFLIEESGFLRTRAVRISGTDYAPPKDLQEIKSKLGEILYEQDVYTNQLKKAIFASTL